MGKSVALGVVTMVVSFSMYEGYIDCYNDVDVNREGILGKNVTLRCRTSRLCDDVRWEMLRENNTVDPHTEEQILVDRYTSVLSIFGIGFHQDGLYRCWCYIGSKVTKICFITLEMICQATVRLGGRTIFYNSTSPIHYVNVTVGERIKIKCPEGGRSESDCWKVRRKESGEFTYKFSVLSKHDFCHIECRLGSEHEDSCIVNLTLNVAILETSTQVLTTSTVASTISSRSPANENPLIVTSTTTNITPAPTRVATVLASDRSISATVHTIVQQTGKDNAVLDKSGSFPVMLFIGIPIVVVVGILFIICFLMYFLRSKSTSRQKKTQDVGNESPDTNIPIGPTYATINKSSPGGDEDSAGRGIPCTDDAYDEVRRDVKKEPTQQDNAVKAETSITKDYYSVVNTSNTKLESTDSGSKSNSALYTEVDKEVKQAGTNVGASSPESSGCNPNVPDVPSDPSYDVLEQPESSEYDAVGVVSTSSALYAVVEKERKKE